MSNDNKIGYGHPPKDAQFKPGTSGNPKGRPRGVKNLKTDLMEEMREKVVIREGAQSRKISKQRAIVKTLVARTLKGDARAATTLMNFLLKVIDPGAGASPTSQPLDAQERDVLEAVKTRLLNEAVVQPTIDAISNATEDKP